MCLGKRQGLRRHPVTFVRNGQLGGASYCACDVGQALRRAGSQGHLGSLGKIEGVRAHQQWAAASGGLDQVVATQWLKAAAQQSHIRQRVIQGHFTQRVANPDIGLHSTFWRHVGPTAAPRNLLEAGTGQHCDGIKTLRVARRDDQQGARHRHCGPRRQERGFFAIA